MFVPASIALTIANATSSLISVSVPPSQPHLSQPLDPYLAAFSLELESWPDWAGKIGSPNAYIQQLLANLQERTGVPPAIRVGGSSLDAAWLDDSIQYVEATFQPPRNNTPYPGASHVRIGRDFYALSGNFADGTKFTWGVPLKSFQLNETLAQAKRMAGVFYGSNTTATTSSSNSSNLPLSQRGIELEYLEIGNEANYWGLPSWWNAKNYTSTFTSWGQSITEVLPLEAGKTELLAGSFTGNAGMYPWSALGTMGYGIFPAQASEGGKGQPGAVGGWSQHKYYGQFDGQTAKPGDMMRKSGIRGNMASLFVDVQAVRSAGRQYVLGETNTYSNHGLPGASNTAESAIFAVDQMLYGATMGISRMYFHNGVGYAYSALCPRGNVNDGYGLNRPHIGALYHAFLIVNEAIGTRHQNDGKAAHVAELATSDNRIAAYGIWEDGWLARAVLINNEPYILEGGQPRRNATVILNNPAQPEGSKQGTIKWFDTPYTNATRGMSWAGQSFDTPDGKPAGDVKTDVWAGAVLGLPASSIALVSFW